MTRTTQSIAYSDTTFRKARTRGGLMIGACLLAMLAVDFTGMRAGADERAVPETADSFMAEARSELARLPMDDGSMPVAAEDSPSPARAMLIIEYAGRIEAVPVYFIGSGASLTGEASTLVSAVAEEARLEGAVRVRIVTTDDSAGSAQRATLEDALLEAGLSPAVMGSVGT